jgi:site-specific DNA recombinase
VVGTLKQLRNAKGVHTKPYLLCHPNRGGKGCIGIMLPETEQYVIDALLDELDKPEFLAAATADDHAGRRDQITAALSDLDAQRNELAAMWATPGH